MKRVWKDPVRKKKQVAAAKKRWQDPEYKKKCSVGLASPMSDFNKQDLAERMKQKWQDPEFKAKMAKKISDTLKTKLMNDSEFLEKTRQNLARGPESLRRSV